MTVTPNKKHQAACQKTLEVLTTPLLPEGFGAPRSVPELLMWLHTRLVRVEGQNPRAGHVRALVVLSNRLGEVIHAIEEAERPRSAKD